MKTKKELQIENSALRQIVVDLAWMARRYVDWRATYATSLYNDHIRVLLAMGIELNPTGDGTIWARDAMGRGYARLSPEEAAMGNNSNYDKWISEDCKKRLFELVGEDLEELSSPVAMIDYYFREGYNRAKAEIKQRVTDGE